MSAAVLAGAAVPLFGVPSAHAAPTTETAAAAGYFSNVGPRDTGTPAGTLPDVGGPADGVAAGNLAVAGGQGQEQKVSFLLFTGEGLEPGASVSSAVLTVPLAEGDGNVSSPNAVPQQVRACAIGDEGFGGEDGASLEVAPTRKCDVFSAPGKASPDGKSYVFDITGLAKLWTEANDGLALTSAEGADTTAFQVVFQPGDKATLAYDATPPADDAEAPAGGGEVPAAGDDAPVSSGGTGTTDLGGGFDAGVEPAPLDLGAGTSGEVPLTAGVDAPLLEPTTELVEAPAPQTAPQAISRAGNDGAVAGREPALTPEPAFWIGLVLLAGLLGLVSLVLGDPEVRRPQTGSTSRLSLALQDRQAGGSADGRRSLALG